MNVQLAVSASCILRELLLRLISLHMSCIMAASEILHSWIDAGLSYQAMTLEKHKLVCYFKV